MCVTLGKLQNGMPSRIYLFSLHFVPCLQCALYLVCILYPVCSLHFVLTDFLERPESDEEVVADFLSRREKQGWWRCGDRWIDLDRRINHKKWCWILIKLLEWLWILPHWNWSKDFFELFFQTWYGNCWPLRLICMRNRREELKTTVRPILPYHYVKNKVCSDFTLPSFCG